MAKVSRPQLKEYFQPNKYPTGIQFSDLTDSYFHKDDKVPVSSVENLPERLNAKYNTTDAEVLEQRTNKIVDRLDELKLDAQTAFESIEELSSQTAEQAAALNAAKGDITTIGTMLKEGATLEQAKSALLELGASYKDVYVIGRTLKTFLDASGTIDTTLEAWRQIEQFLQEITNTESLTAMLAVLEDDITAAYNAAIAVETSRALAAEQKLQEGIDASKVLVIDSLTSTDKKAALSADRGRTLSQQVTALNDSVGAGVLLVDEMAKSEYLSFDRSDNHILYIPTSVQGALLPVGEVIYPFRMTDGITLDKKEIRKYGPATEDVDGKIRFRLTEPGNYIIFYKVTGGNWWDKVIVTEGEATIGYVVCVDDYIKIPTVEDSTGACAGSALRRYVRIYKKVSNSLPSGFAYRYSHYSGYKQIIHRRPFLTKDTLIDPETGSKLLKQPKLKKCFQIKDDTAIRPELFTDAEDGGSSFHTGWQVQVKKSKSAVVTRKSETELRADMHYTGYSGVNGRTLRELAKMKSVYRTTETEIYFDLKIVSAGTAQQEIARYRVTRMKGTERYIVRKI